MSATPPRAAGPAMGWGRLVDHLADLERLSRSWLARKRRIGALDSYQEFDTYDVPQLSRSGL